MLVSLATVYVLIAIRTCSCLLLWLIVGVVVTLTGAHTWLNDFGGSFTFNCPRGHSISGISSIYKHYYDDRLYNLTCSPVTDGGHETGCSWSGYTNSIVESVNYKCPANTYIVGADSYLNHIFQNRRFSFKCCEDFTNGSFNSTRPLDKNRNGEDGQMTIDLPETLMMYDCNITDWQNSFGEPLHFTVPEGKLLSAVYSQGKDESNDWRFKFEICKLSKYLNSASSRFDLR